MESQDYYLSVGFNHPESYANLYGDGGILSDFIAKYGMEALKKLFPYLIESLGEVSKGVARKVSKKISGDGFQLAGNGFQLAGNGKKKPRGRPRKVTYC